MNATAFTTDNSQFSSAEIATLNAAHDRLMAACVYDDTTDSVRQEIQKSLCDQLNNAWVEGITVDELVQKARFGHV